jgi:hypothetical protein
VEEAIRGTKNLNPEDITQRANIRHKKMLTKSLNKGNVPESSSVMIMSFKYKRVQDQDAR